MPVVTALAFRTQDEYNQLVGSTNDQTEDVPERAFVVGELLQLATHLDYADETGRRKMFQLTRKLAGMPELTEYRRDDLPGQSTSKSYTSMSGCAEQDIGWRTGSDTCRCGCGDRVERR